jgi:hypothetical protein
VERHLSLPVVASILIILVLEVLVLILLLLLLLFIFVPDLLLKDNAIHTSLQQSANSSSLALEEPEAIEWHGSGGTSEVGEFV